MYISIKEERFRTLKRQQNRLTHKMKATAQSLLLNDSNYLNPHISVEIISVWLEYCEQNVWHDA